MAKENLEQFCQMTAQEQVLQEKLKAKAQPRG